MIADYNSNSRKEDLFFIHTQKWLPLNTKADQVQAFIKSSRLHGPRLKTLLL